MRQAPLLDTHAWIWWLHADPRLGQTTLAALDGLGPGERPAICDISLWEVATLVARKRLHLDKPLGQWLRFATDPRTVRMLPINRHIALELAQLRDPIPRDPADRLIIATSRALGLPLLTFDDEIRKSGLVRLWRTAAEVTDYARLLPRVFDLRASLRDSGHRDAYFQDFENKLRSHQVFDTYAKLERFLAALDEGSWEDLRARAAEKLIARQRSEGRGWQDLFDVLNEAVAFAYLNAIGAENLRFLPPDKTRKRPDIEGVIAQGRILCEVKTMNKSELQAGRDKLVMAGQPVVTKSPTTLPDSWLKKLAAKIGEALTQLRADASDGVRMVIFVVINFDDRIGDYHDLYFRQIDEFLDDLELAGIDLVLFPSTNLFERTYAMRNATVFLG